MPDKHIDFKVDYAKLKIFDEHNVKDIKYPLVLSVPHKGAVFPEEFLANSQCSIAELRSNEDSFVDELVEAASNEGIPMIAMNIARSFVDVNRDKIELDPTMFYNHPHANETNIGGRRCRVGLVTVLRPRIIIYTTGFWIMTRSPSDWLRFMILITKNCSS